MSERVSGIFIRVNENGTWISKDIALCSEEQIRGKLRGWTKDETIDCIVALCQVLSDVNVVTNDMVKMLSGISDHPVDPYPLK